MIKNYDQPVKINHNPNWSYIPDDLYRILIIGSSGSGKTNNFVELNKTSTTKYWQNLFIHQRFTRINVSIAC